MLVKTSQGSNKLPSLSTGKTNLGVVGWMQCVCVSFLVCCTLWTSLLYYNCSEISSIGRIKEDVGRAMQVTSPGTALLHLSSTWGHLSQPALKK